MHTIVLSVKDSQNMYFSLQFNHEQLCVGLIKETSSEKDLSLRL